MPTGYTEPLYAGTPITFPEFALRCARAMGVAIMQRDESIDVPIRAREVEPYYAERVTQTEEALTVALARTIAEWEEARDVADDGPGQAGGAPARAPRIGSVRWANAPRPLSSSPHACSSPSSTRSSTSTTP